MDESTEGVTLFYGFLTDLISCFDSQSAALAPLVEFARPYEGSDTDAPVPMSVYNDMCAWIEAKLGAASLRKAGIAIGDRAYDQMVAAGAAGPKSTPLDIVNGLVYAAATMIQDPKGRGWRILDSSERRIVMRRTQTFNAVLQEGLLESLVRRSGVGLVKVRRTHCVTRGDEYSDYEITWLDQS